MFAFVCLFVVWLVGEDQRNGKDHREDKKHPTLLMWPRCREKWLWQGWRSWLNERRCKIMIMTTDALGHKCQSPSQIWAPNGQLFGSFSVQYPLQKHWHFHGGQHQPTQVRSTRKRRKKNYNVSSIVSGHCWETVLKNARINWGGF